MCLCIRGVDQVKKGEGRSGTDSPQGRRSLGLWSVQPTFQSVSRDAPKINGFPVAGGTTPISWFLGGQHGQTALWGFWGLWMDLNKGGSNRGSEGQRE